jgi:diphthamide synthase (EF-2-diphthine--ammonia ligase)
MRKGLHAANAAHAAAAATTKCAAAPIAWRSQAGTDIEPVFPLWHRPPDQLARDMIAGGLETYLSTVDLNKLPASFAGRKFNAALLADFPAGIDPCGENGEFHSCVVADPMFTRRIEVKVGDTVERDAFAYADLLPV